jgi:hypothetical protein
MPESGDPHRRRTAILAALAGGTLLAAALAGCVGAAPTSDPTSSATSTPTPKPAFTMTCATAIDPAVITGINSTLTPQTSGRDYVVMPPASPGFSMSSINPDAIPIYPPSSTSMQAALGQGFYNCFWSSSTDQLQVTLDVLPAAMKSFTTYTSDADTKASYDLARFSSVGVGDQATGGCSSRVESETGEHCELDALAGQLWVRVAIDYGTRQAVANSAIQKQLTDATSSALAAIKRTGAEPAPMPVPSSAWSSITECSQMLGRTTTPTEPLDMTDALDAVFRAAVIQSGGVECDDQQQQITALPGGGWSWPIAYAPSRASTPTPVTVPGATAARYVCAVNNSPDCWTEAVIDHALVMVNGESQSADIQTLQTIATQVAKG